MPKSTGPCSLGREHCKLPHMLVAKRQCNECALTLHRSCGTEILDEETGIFRRLECPQGFGCNSSKLPPTSTSSKSNNVSVSGDDLIAPQTTTTIGDVSTYVACESANSTDAAKPPEVRIKGRRLEVPVIPQNPDPKAKADLSLPRYLNTPHPVDPVLEYRGTPLKCVQDVVVRW
jgi:hypothetical protein